MLHLWFTESKIISRIVLAEQIQLSQRIGYFALSALLDGEEKIIYEGTTVGYKKICAFKPVPADAVVLRILQSRVAPTIKHFAVNARQHYSNIVEKVY